MDGSELGAPGVDERLRMRMKSSLGARLLVAFLLVAGFPALTAFFGWFELRDVARTQSETFDNTIPGLSEVRGFAEESSRIVAVSPELAAVTVEGDRRDRAAFLYRQVGALSERLSRYEKTGGAGTGDIAEAVTQVEMNIVALDQMVRTRIALLQAQQERLAAALAATTELLGIADTLVANAQMGMSAVISNLYEFEATPIEPHLRLDTLDKLIEVDLFQLGLMFELRSRTAEIGLLLNRVAGLTNFDDLAEVSDALRDRTDIVARRVQAIHDPARADQARALLEVIQLPDEGLEHEGDIVSLTREIFAVERRIGSSQAALRVNADRLDRAAAELADQAQAAAVAAGSEAMAAISATQTRYALSALVALILSCGILWFYIRGNISRRLDRLSGLMADLAAGQMHMTIAPSGTDEIARMERAVEVFRLQAIANRELEQARERNQSELRRHRNELQQLVEEKTEKLQGEVDAHADARRKAEAADLAKSEFLAMMSHEIRTPMNGMLGMMRILSLEDLNERQHDQLRAAQVSGESLLTILNDILDYSKIEAGDISQEVVTFSVASLVREVATLMHPGAREKGLQLRLDLPVDLPPAVSGDVGKLRQILFNLLSNSLKFTDRGEVSLRLWVRERQENTVWLRFEITDSGKGIEPANIERIFHAFEQENAQTARRYGGTGLGLAICRKLATVMGGDLTVQSAPGCGSKFIFDVGFSLKDVGAPAGAIALWKPRHPARRLQVLIVEDHDVNQMVAVGYLARMGHHPTCASSGEEALDLLRTRSFDLILMDVNLPGISGEIATRQIRALPGATGNIPIIGISAHVQKDEVKAHLEAGMNRFVPKPLLPQQLEQAITEVMQDQNMPAKWSHAGPTPGSSPSNDVLGKIVADIGPVRAADLGWQFLSQLNSEAHDLEEAMTIQDAAATRKLAHRMKGAAGNFDLSALVCALHQIERAAAQGTTREVTSMRELLTTSVDQARRDLTAALGDRAVSPSTDDTSPDDAHPARSTAR